MGNTYRSNRQNRDWMLTLYVPFYILFFGTMKSSTFLPTMQDAAWMTAYVAS